MNYYEIHTSNSRKVKNNNGLLKRFSDRVEAFDHADRLKDMYPNTTYSVLYNGQIIYKPRKVK